MLDSVLGFGVLGFLGTMAWLGIRQPQGSRILAA